jgi:RNA 3'-terminal phosphate cyclase (ATP)
MIEIDGSFGEGGGQVLRTSLALAIITQQPVRIYNIRIRRKNPGLAPQHLSSVLAAARICDADVKGAQLRSMDLTFTPNSAAKSGEYIFDVSEMSGQGSAGAVTLVLQTILLPLALANGSSKLTLRGGTNVSWSPPIHYIDWVLLPTLAEMGLAAKVKINNLGWYPVGGGEVEVNIKGDTELTGIDLSKRGEFVNLRGSAIASNLPAHIPQRISARANNVLYNEGLPGAVQPIREGGNSTGVGIFLAGMYENAAAGFSALGEKGKPSEEVADEAVHELVRFNDQDQALDPHLPDQLLPAMALADGPSSMSTMQITLHTITNIGIVQRFVDRQIQVQGNQDAPGVIHVI